MAKYQKYAKYKDSGVEWLVEIPSHWDAIRLKHLIVGNLVYGANEAAEDDNPNNPRYIRITDMNNDGSLDPNTFRSLPYHIAENYLLEDGDILLARSGATVGKSFLFKDEFGVSCFAGYLIRARPDCRKLNSQFAYWFFQSDSYWKYISGSQIQSTIQNVSAEKYGDLYLSLPEKLNHQKIIANFLNHETAKIDSLIANQEKLIELLKEKRQAVISHAVTKGLNPDVAMKDSGVEWLGQVPGHWINTSLSKLALIKRGSGYQNISMEVEGKDSIPMLRISDMHEISPTLVVKNNEVLRYLVNEGDILFAGTGATAGISMVVPKECNGWVHSYNSIKVKVNETKVNSNYLQLFLTCDYVQKTFDSSFVGSAQPFIDTNNLGNLKITLPPLDEQDAIYAYLSGKIKDIGTLVEKAESAIQLMQERRTALISAAVTGKIDVRHHASRPTGNDKKQTEDI